MTTTNKLSGSNRHHCFDLAAESFIRWKAGEPAPTVHFDGRVHTLGEVCGLVWNSGAIFPGGTVLDELRETLEFESRTYAAIARAMKSYLN